MARVIEALVHFFPEECSIDLTTDGHSSYRQVLSRAKIRGRHAAFPNPERGPKKSPRSAQAIVRDRAMFPADALHGLLRHSESHHRRETIAFGRRTNAILERLYLAIAWRNFVKGFRSASPISRPRRCDWG